MSLLEHIMQNIISYNTVNNITEVINKNKTFTKRTSYISMRLISSLLIIISMH